MDLNVVALTGRLGRDPEMRYTASGKAVVNFSLAVQTGKESVMWLDVSAWEKLAETVNTYMKKGSAVAISGRLQQDEWETDEGVRRVKIRVTAHTVRFVGSKSDNQASAENAVMAEPDGGPATDYDKDELLSDLPI